MIVRLLGWMTIHQAFTAKLETVAKITLIGVAQKIGQLTKFARLTKSHLTCRERNLPQTMLPLWPLPRSPSATPMLLIRPSYSVSPANSMILPKTIAANTLILSQTPADTTRKLWIEQNMSIEYQTILYSKVLRLWGWTGFRGCHASSRHQRTNVQNWRRQFLDSIQFRQSSAVFLRLGQQAARCGHHFVSHSWRCQIRCVG